MIHPLGVACTSGGRGDAAWVEVREIVDAAFLHCLVARQTVLINMLDDVRAKVAHFPFISSVWYIVHCLCT